MSLEAILDNTILESMFTDEQKMFRQVLRKWSKNEIAPNTREWAKIEGYCWPLQQTLAKQGYLGVCVPEEYGGLDGSLVELAMLCEEVTRNGVSLPLTHISSSALVLRKFGTEEQKRKYLPDLAAGNKVFCYAQTEADAGSDVANMKTTAVLKGDHYVINGTKQFISGSYEGQVFILLAKTDLTAPGTTGISTFIVERGYEGLSFGKKETKMGSNYFSMSPVILDNCIVPKENLVIPAGEKMKELFNEFNGERVGNTAICCGYARGALERAIDYAQQRVVGKQTLSKYQGLRWMFADDIITLTQARFLMYNAAFKGVNGLPVAADAAMAKCFANEMAQKLTNNAIQIHGGNGYMTDYELERFYRDCRASTFGGGTPQVLRNRIASELFK